jgi:signal transduction histidine kinase
MKEAKSYPPMGYNMKSSIDVAVLRDQVDLLYGRKRLATFSFPILGVLIAYILSEYSGTGIALGWFLAVCAVTAVGIAISELYRKKSASLDRTLFWARVGVAGSALNGVTFGAAGLLLYPPHSVPHQAFLVLFLGGICACALASSSSYLPAYLFFVVPTMCPIIVRLALDADGMHVIMSILTVIFTGFMVALGKVGSSAIKEACILKHEKIALVQELEAFSYSVSHDLRAPLRAIDGFSRFVLEGYKEKLDDEGKRLLNIIRTNTQKMDQLITDMLKLSRTSLTEMKLSRIDMTTLVNSIYREILSPEIQEKFVFSVSSLPDIFGDPALIRQVWTNLISNAIKYTLPKEERRIEIGGGVENSVNIYYIKDTGVGFNPDYTHKLFDLFQRLHKAEEFEGTGVGLAIVQRIILRHGGKVWAEGKVNEGATFYFSLPKKT